MNLPHLHLSPRDFTERFMAYNAPVILLGLTDDWPARKQWTLPSPSNLPPSPNPLPPHHFPSFPTFPALLSHLRCFLASPPPPSSPTSLPNLLHLATLVPLSTPPIVDCSLPSHPRTSTLPASVYFQRWAASTLPPTLYLKDWHLPLLLSAQLPFYTPPPHFIDWLNPLPCPPPPSTSPPSQPSPSPSPSPSPPPTDDYRFVYASPARCYTGVHCDVLRSFSWSANIVGRKLWLMVQPEGEGEGAEADWPMDLLDADAWVGEVGRGVKGVDMGRVRVGVQEEGEVVFVPAGWVHQVWQVDDSVSINHNWHNGWSVGQLWGLVREEEEAARRILGEFEAARGEGRGRGGGGGGVVGGEVDEEGVQMMVRANAGMNREDVERLLTAAAAHERRLLDDLNASNPAVRQAEQQWLCAYYTMSLARVRSILAEIKEGKVR